MKKLTEAEIIQLIREEWNAKIKSLSEKVDLSFQAKVDGTELPVIDKGLKLRNKVKKGKNDKKDTMKGYLYTVDSVSPNGAILKTPEGKLFPVDKQTLEAEYELD